jgi:hypothetical protein
MEVERCMVAISGSNLSRLRSHLPDVADQG